MTVSDSELPLISVIIPTYKDGHRLTLCVEAIGRQSYPQHLFEVIVVDNEGGDACVRETGDSRCSVIRETKPGAYAARNAGIRAANGTLYAFTDADCVPHEQWLESGIEFLERNPEFSHLGGRIDVFFEDESLNLTEVYEKAFGFRQEQIATGRKYTVTANMMVRASAFDKVGLFREDLYSGGDIEWCMRASGLGYKIGYSENTIVRHPARKSLRELLTKRVRVIGGEYASAASPARRVLIVVVGFIPPVMALSKLKGREDLVFKEKVQALFVLYLTRLLRSVYFVAISIGLVRPKRA